MESMEGDGAQIIPVTPEISAAYLCKECFIDFTVEEVVNMTRQYLHTERGLFKKRFWEWKRGNIDYDPCTYLEASVLFLRGHIENPPFPSTTFILSRTIQGHPRVTHRRHLALISFP
jgi:hypothetical protein